MSLGIFILIYFICAVLSYLFFNILITTNKEVDPEFDEAMDNGSAKMLALLFTSLIWPISVACIIYDNIGRSFKNERD